MAGIGILKIRVVGICSKHRQSEDEAERYNDGRIIPDKELSCIDCEQKRIKEK